MKVMIIVVDHNWPCLHAFSAIEGRPALSWRVVIDFVVIRDIREPLFGLQRHRSLGVERFRPRTSRAISFALEASADTIIACKDS